MKKNIYLLLYEKERERAGAQGGGAKGEGKRDSVAGSTTSVEPDMVTDPTTVGS